LICGLVLAAGEGTRFGPEPKLCALLNGRPLLEHAVSAHCAVAELERVVVVLGAFSDEVLRRVELGRAEPVICPDWASGQSASLRRGVAALSDASKVIVTLGDEPLISPSAIRRFVEQPPGARAVYGGRPGHPVVLGPAEMAAVARLTGDRGAREILGGPAVECSDLCSGRDVDTMEDLEVLGDEARAVL
jgi:CTP:molybdopterin cytidylyltransferase MocA